MLLTNYQLTNLKYFETFSFGNINTISNATEMIRPMIGKFLSTCFFCGGKDTMNKRAYDLEDVKLDSEISEAIPPDERTPEKNEKGNEKGNEKQNMTKNSKKTIKTIDQIKPKAYSSKEPSSKPESKKISEVEKNRSAISGEKVSKSGSGQIGSKYFSSGMVRMAIMKKNRANEKGKKELESIRNNGISQRKGKDEKEEGKLGDTNSIISAYSETHEEDGNSEDDVDETENSNHSIERFLYDKHEAKERTTSEESDGNSNTKEKDDKSEKNDLTQKTAKSVDTVRRERSIEEYLLDESVMTESCNTDGDPEISCSVDFYNKREFSKMLLKTIKQYLKNAQLNDKNK